MNGSGVRWKQAYKKVWGGQTDGRGVWCVVVEASRRVAEVRQCPCVVCTREGIGRVSAWCAARKKGIKAHKRREATGRMRGVCWLCRSCLT